MRHRNSTRDSWFWLCQKTLRGAAPGFVPVLTAVFFARGHPAVPARPALEYHPAGRDAGIARHGAGLSRPTNGVQVTWDGPSGYYQVWHKSHSLTDAPWLAAGNATIWPATPSITSSTATLSSASPARAPKYAGAKVCITCHANICRYETNTPHASAFSSPTFAAQGGQTNTLCLPCHTVGYGLPTGFNLTNRGGIFSYPANLAGVQCENCHGPAANHAAAPDDPTMVPRVEIAATVCGGCHTASPTAHTNNAPTFEEWSASGHAAVVPDALQSMSSSHQQHPQLRRLPFRFRPAGDDRRHESRRHAHERLQCRHRPAPSATTRTRRMPIRCNCATRSSSTNFLR